ncbi:IclR family transcriptional regulator [Rhodococcus wratislaviensis]|uniref:Glycerol operon regulatory protein n=1 Tax=Rhodococcus wratislaviensis TaxID=44752 RepID=A0AB38FDD0_RHOWR|nr:IclR family transcriptional regulator [Rhodococcus wratislaviensis]REE75477.1 IclR family transcriptional regulator [Rhodococcus wratislaviensis]SPZ39488.1 IclR family transcriptional regulator [Rhodococcus wratislaviensis]
MTSSARDLTTEETGVALAVPTTREHTRPEGGVQSVARVFALLETLADAGGVAGVSELAEMSDVPLPTIHRFLRTLVALGYVRQEPSRAYALGPRLVRLGEAASRLLEGWANPHLRRLADAVGESANFALLDGAHVVYVAQAPGHHSMRMFTEVGQRVSVHCTAVGKAILATYPKCKAAQLIDRADMQAHTDRTITTPNQMMQELDAIRARGYGLDLGEQELGVSCVAVALPGSPARGAVSISGPQARMTEVVITEAVPILTQAAHELSRELELMTAEAKIPYADRR